MLNLKTVGVFICLYFTPSGSTMGRYLLYYNHITPSGFKVRFMLFGFHYSGNFTQFVRTVNPRFTNPEGVKGL